MAFITRRSCPQSRDRLLALGAGLLSVAASCTSAETPPNVSATAASATPPGIASRRDDTPAARRLAAWLAAFNSGDAAALRAHQENAFASGRASADLTFIEREVVVGRAAFDLRRTESSNPTRVVAILSERTSARFVRAMMDVEPDEPHRVTWFHVHPIPIPDEFRPSRMTEADALEALRAELAAATSGDRFSGVVLVAKDGTPIFSAAHGFADRERRIPNELDTRFRIGSMNKMFTAVAVLQLVQAGKLELSDHLGKLLPEYAGDRVASTVTIHQLLTHTGGTGNIFGPEFDAKRLELRTIQDYVHLHAHREPSFRPGSLWEYSNYGFILLGAVIERVAGESYYDWVASRVFAPAAMTSTSSPPEDGFDARRSTGYTQQTPGSDWISAANMLPYRGTSAGGGQSTVADLLRFANALTGHVLLDAEHTALLTTGKVEMTLGGKYAYGFVDATTRGVRCVGHGGGFPGMNAHLGICDSGYTIAVLSNLDPPAANRIATFIMDRLPARSAPRASGS